MWYACGEFPVFLGLLVFWRVLREGESGDITSIYAVEAPRLVDEAAEALQLIRPVNLHKGNRKSFGSESVFQIRIVRIRTLIARNM